MLRKGSGARQNTSSHRKPTSTTKSTTSNRRHQTSRSISTTARIPSLSQLKQRLGQSSSPFNHKTHISSTNATSAFSTGGPLSTPSASISIRKLSSQERKHLKKQRKGRVIYVPAYVHAKDLSQRMHTTLLQLHKAGTQFFSWWPRASERQLKKDGYSMLSDLVLRFDESYLLLKLLGYKGVYEHTGIERIRNEHYALQRRLQQHRQRGEHISAGLKRDLAQSTVGRGTGPEPTPDDLKLQHIQPKQPVVCIVGHVNHGKTTLLDTLRGTYLAKREDGGITQDLYAYQCDIGSDIAHNWGQDDKASFFTAASPTAHSAQRHELDRFEQDDLLQIYSKVTFLDTPGHASFFDMRENGTLFSDLVVLVVSSVEGVCPQTLESIEYIKSFKLPVVIALTKTDLPNSNVRGVMKQLQQAGLSVKLYDQPGAFDNLSVADDSAASQQSSLKRPSRAPVQVAPVVPMSAIDGNNMVAFRQSLMQCFMNIGPQADIRAPPVGLVLESFKEEGGRGTVMRVLLSSGIIERNDEFISGLFSGRVKDLRVFGDITMNQFTIDPKTTSFPNAAPNGLIPGTAASLASDDFDIAKHAVRMDSKSRKTLLQQDKSFGIGQRKPILGEKVDYAIPGVPLEIVGLNGLPHAGDDLRVVPTAMLARTIAETRRLELEYTEQSRFEIGGLKITDWVPPPLLFKKDYQKNPTVLEQYVDEKAILNPKQDDSALATLSDVDTDHEYDGDDDEDAGSRKLRSKKRAVIGSHQSRKTQFGHDEQTDYGDAQTDQESGSESHESSNESDYSHSEDGSYSDEDKLYDAETTMSSTTSRKGLSKSHSGDEKDIANSTSTALAPLKKKQFSHNNSQSSTIASHWNRVHEIEFEYQRPFVIKGATAGGVKMILDSIDAFNQRYPTKKIHVVHAMQGSLTENDLMRASSAIDKDLDPNMNCPVLLYRTKKPTPRVLKKAKIVGINIFSYTVFDDLLKHLVGTHYYNEMFHDSSNLRQFEPGALFRDATTAPAPHITPLSELSQLETTPLAARQSQSRFKRVMGASSRLISPLVPASEAADNSTTPEATASAERTAALKRQIDIEYEEWRRARQAAAAAAAAAPAAAAPAAATSPVLEESQHPIKTPISIAPSDASLPEPTSPVTTIPQQSTPAATTPPPVSDASNTPSTPASNTPSTPASTTLLSNINVNQPTATSLFGNTKKFSFSQFTPTRVSLSTAVNQLADGVLKEQSLFHQSIIEEQRASGAKSLSSLSKIQMIDDSKPPSH